MTHFSDPGGTDATDPQQPSEAFNCDEITEADHTYCRYVRTAVAVTTASILNDPNGSAGTAVLQLEIVHTDAQCQAPLADACIHIVADPPLKFVAPAAGEGASGVSYWDRAVSADPAVTDWDRLSPGQTTRGPEVILLGQTLPIQISTQPGAGYLHYRADNPTDGWTVRVGVTPPPHGTRFQVTVAARPYPSPVSGPFVLSV